MQACDLLQGLIPCNDVYVCACDAQACDLLQGLIPSKDDKDGVTPSPDHYRRLYVFTLMWSIGAFLELDDRYATLL